MSPFNWWASVQSGLRASALDANSSARSKSPLGSPETPLCARRKNFQPFPVRAWTLLGSMASACSQSAYAASAALESQVLGVWIGRGRPFETGGLGLGELKVHCARQMRDDRVLHLQQIGAGR